MIFTRQSTEVKKNPKNPPNKTPASKKKKNKKNDKWNIFTHERRDEACKRDAMGGKQASSITVNP